MSLQGTYGVKNCKENAELPAAPILHPLNGAQLSYWAQKRFSRERNSPAHLNEGGSLFCLASARAESSRALCSFSFSRNYDPPGATHTPHARTHTRSLIMAIILWVRRRPLFTSVLARSKMGKNIARPYFTSTQVNFDRPQGEGAHKFS